MNRILSFAALALLAARPAAAASRACWFDNDVVVVSAQVAGVAGDYILDVATPRTVLAETQAQAAGYAQTQLTGDILLAGLQLKAHPITVSDLDLRTGALPTPVAGVIGADALADLVVDLDFRPCRVSLWRRGQAPPFRPAQKLPLDWVAARPTVRAAVADGPHAFGGAFALATGGDTAVRLSDAMATAPGAAKPKELYPYGVLRPKLRAFSFAGELWQNLPAGLTSAEDPALAGQIGAPILAAWRLRIDLAHGQLLLAAASREKGPGVNRGPRRRAVGRR